MTAFRRMAYRMLAEPAGAAGGATGAGANSDCSFAKNIVFWVTACANRLSPIE